MVIQLSCGSSIRWDSWHIEPPQEQAINLLIDFSATIISIVIFWKCNSLHSSSLQNSLFSFVELFLRSARQRANGKQFGTKEEEIQKTS